MSWFLLASLLLGSLWAMAMAVMIVLQRRSAAATLAWLLVLIFVPFLGLLLYRVIGPLRLEKKKLKRRRTRKLVEEALGAIAAIEAATHDRDHGEVARVGISVGEAPPLRADEVTVFTEGEPAYAALCAAIEAARHHVHLEYYIWEPDRFGLRLVALLAARARAGVKVRVLVDGVGAYHLKRRHLAPLLEAGGELAWFNPVRIGQVHRKRADFRTHRKIVVCDGVVGFTGGMNITDDHSAEFRGALAWRDTHVRIAGAAVRALQRVFVDDWYFATEKLPDIAGAAYFPAPVGTPAEALGRPIVQIVSSGPDSARAPIHRVYFAAMNSASERLWVTTPYFIPDEAILTALISAALRRIDVRLIIPARGDSRLIDLAARSYLPELLSAGVRVFEYLPRFVHAKTLVVDQAISAVGTANMDYRSFRLNFEVTALVFARETNESLAAAFLKDQESTREFGLAEFDTAPFARRFGQAAARLMSPLL